MTAALRLTDLHSYYGKSHILQGVSLELGEGEIVTLLGRNGAGKSTTLKTAVGAVAPRSGRVELGCIADDSASGAGEALQAYSSR